MSVALLGDKGEGMSKRKVVSVFMKLAVHWRRPVLVK